MSSDRNSPPLPSPGAAGRRRSSFIDLFTSRPPGNANPNQGSTPAYPGPITTAAAQAQQRRLSLSTVGLSGSPNQASPFNNARARAESVSSAYSSSVDESPFEDGDSPSSGPPPTSPFARRLSFGARALQSVRTGNGNGNTNGRPSVIQEAVVDSSSPATAPRAPSTGRGQGFDYAENLRSRAERSSISAASTSSNGSMTHPRSKSMTIMEPPTVEIPQPKRPDAFQERILKGDFYMD